MARPCCACRASARGTSLSSIWCSTPIGGPATSCAATPCCSTRPTCAGLRLPPRRRPRLRPRRKRRPTGPRPTKRLALQRSPHPSPGPRRRGGPSLPPPARGAGAAGATRPVRRQAPVGGAAMAPSAGVTAQVGDTASRIASANKPQGVSLDQMLVALLHANPEAFVQSNVNRLKAGAILRIPDQAPAQSIPAAQARRMLAAQARDFSEFRRRLAGAVPMAKVAAAQRSASGSVSAQVEDNRPATAAPDRLTLSKGSVKGYKAAAAEEQLAKDKQASETATRMAQLSKNIAELSNLGTGSPKSTAAAQTTAPAAAQPAAPAATAQIAVPAAVTIPTPAAIPAPPAAPPAPEAFTAPPTTH